ncbi:YkgJ family cysteine cluster protein [bacterium]|nr:YkgJ family cysteine cluster protein [bacterium]
MADTWQTISSRYAAYTLAMPGAATFRCQPELCDAHCCRAFTVNLGESEVSRMAASSGLPASRFLESSHGEPLALPLAQPYILARRHNRCALLGPSLTCSQYEGRPNACRLYPHFMIFFDRVSGRPVHGHTGAVRESIDALRTGHEFGALVPMLVRHVECPGFTGEPMTAGEWLALVTQTYALQFPAD